MSRSLTHLLLRQTCCSKLHYAANSCTCEAESHLRDTSEWHCLGRCRFFPTEALPGYLSGVKHPSPPLDHEHIVQYHTYHPCESRCHLCELYAVRIYFPRGHRSELGFAPRKVCDRKDNTDVVGAPQVLFRDIVARQLLPVLHQAFDTPLRTCDCVELEEEPWGDASPPIPIGWRRHGHWQIVTEHHHCAVCWSRCIETRTRTTPVAVYQVLTAKGYEQRRGWGTLVKSQATQTENDFFPSLEQITLCTAVQQQSPTPFTYPQPLPPASFRFKTVVTPVPAFFPRAQNSEWREDIPATTYRELLDAAPLRLRHQWEDMI